MSVVELPDEVAARFAAEAERQGITVDELLADLAERLPSLPTEKPQRTLGFVSLGASTSGRHARYADEMLAEGFGRS